ncbi:Tyrosine-protein phosphatase Lar [Blattella germanica]|nr:Tyrosine-protein phosphatase Lar [Blattella germanica]
MSVFSLDIPPKQGVEPRYCKIPGDPQDVRATSINSTAIRVQWRPPLEKDRNGIIRGYHIHVQETKEEGQGLLNDPMRFDVLDGNAQELNVTGLQPDTKYSIQVAALTRKGDGDRSSPVTVKTPGGVPNRPTVTLKVMEREPTVSIELEWGKPSQTYGDLLGYRLRYGVKDQKLKEQFFKGTMVHSHKINDLERGVEYEFRVAGQNTIGFGQESIKYLLTPEGPPSGPPTNISHHFQTPDVVCVTWDVPLREHRNGQITHYDVEFHKKAVFTNLEENTDYVFRVRAHTSQGGGPYSDKITVHTEKDIIRAPMSVQAVATSDQSVEVWWEPVPSRMSSY